MNAAEKKAVRRLLSVADRVAGPLAVRVLSLPLRTDEQLALLDGVLSAHADAHHLATLLRPDLPNYVRLVVRKVVAQARELRRTLRWMDAPGGPPEGSWPQAARALHAKMEKLREEAALNVQAMPVRRVETTEARRALGLVRQHERQGQALNPASLYPCLQTVMVQAGQVAFLRALACVAALRDGEAQLGPGWGCCRARDRLVCWDGTEVLVSVHPQVEKREAQAAQFLQRAWERGSG